MQSELKFIQLKVNASKYYLIPLKFKLIQVKCIELNTIEYNLNLNLN